jgi:hypothetical protein
VQFVCVGFLSVASLQMFTILFDVPFLAVLREPVLQQTECCGTLGEPDLHHTECCDALGVLFM